MTSKLIIRSHMMAAWSNLMGICGTRHIEFLQDLFGLGTQPQSANSKSTWSISTKFIFNKFRIIISFLKKSLKNAFYFEKENPTIFFKTKWNPVLSHNNHSIWNKLSLGWGEERLISTNIYTHLSLIALKLYSKY